jgi:hypothetical protein
MPVCSWTFSSSVLDVYISSLNWLLKSASLFLIYHKTEKASIVNLHFSRLTYWVVNTIRHQPKQKDINNQWRDMITIMMKENNGHHNKQWLLSTNHHSPMQ